MYVVGPLTYTDGFNVTYAIGVVSWGGECGDSMKSGVYANVYTEIDWIRKNMNKRYKC